MTRLNLLASAVILSLAATAGGSAFGAGHAGWAVELSGKVDGGNRLVLAGLVLAGFERHRVSRYGFERGHRHRFGKPRRRGFRHRHWRDRYFFSFAFPYYGHYRYDRYDYPYAPPLAPAPSAGPAPPTAPDESSDCREIVMDVIIGGVEQKAYGTACQQADGSWKITN